MKRTLAHVLAFFVAAYVGLLGPVLAGTSIKSNASGGISVASGAGTTNRLMKFDASDNAADACWTDDGTLTTTTACTGFGLGTATPKTVLTEVMTRNVLNVADGAAHGVLAVGGLSGGILDFYDTNATVNVRRARMDLSNTTWRVGRINDDASVTVPYLTGELSTDAVALSGATVTLDPSGTGKLRFLLAGTGTSGSSPWEIDYTGASEGSLFISGLASLNLKLGFFDTISGGTTSRAQSWYLNDVAKFAFDTAGPNIPSDANYRFSSTTSAIGPPDLALKRVATGGLGISDDANGKAVNIKQATELTTIAAAATTDTTIQIPANSLVIAVTVRVTTVIPTAATFDIGVAGATTRYGTGVSTAANTTNSSPGTTNPTIYASAVKITFTPNLTPADTTGRVRTTIYYIDATAPTS